MPRARLDYPVIRPGDSTVEVAGRAFADPFRSLEHPTDEVLIWQRKQRELAANYLQKLPIRARVERALQAISVPHPSTLPVRRGERWFQLTDYGGERVLGVSDAIASAPTVVIAGSTLGDKIEPGATIDWFHPSPDGALVAFGASSGGAEDSTLLVVEVESGALLGDRIPGATGAFVAWLPDHTSFVVNAAAGERLQQQLYLHRIGDAESTPIDLDFGSAARMWPQVSADEQHLTVLTNDPSGMRPWYVCSTQDPLTWMPFLKDAAGAFSGRVVGGEFFAVTSADAPRGRVVAIPVANPHDPSSWRELVCETGAHIEAVWLAGGGLLIQSFTLDGVRLDWYDLQGRHQHRVPLPGRGSVTVDPLFAGGPPDPSWREIPLAYSSVDRSESIYVHDVDSNQTRAVSPPAFIDDSISSDVHVAKSRDGTEVPVTVFFRRGVETGKPRPTVVLAYGSHGVPWLPRFSPSTIVFLDAGGVFAVPHLRGGGEFGTDWWNAGRREKKQNTFDDLYAVVECLIAAGVARREKVGLIGGSAGGLLAGAAIAQRPELFVAISMQVPILDLLRSAYVDEWDSGRYEFGDARLAEEAQWLASYSPYTLLRDDVDYPATMITAGEEDVRCPPWHARKFAARLQHANRADTPILLNVIPSGGHLGPGGADESFRHSVDSLAFLMHHLGLEPAEP